MLVLLSLVGCGPNASVVDQQRGIVNGASMAPTLKGRHLKFDCPECKISFSADPVQTADAPRVVCPNCGCQQIGAETGVAVAADSVTVSLGQPPKRWDVVAFRPPAASTRKDRLQQFAIKRIVGLPGESILIQRGNLWTQTGGQGKPLHKPFSVNQQIKMLVHDSKFTGKEARWQASPNSVWRHSANGYRMDAQPASTGSALDWMAFQPRRCYRHPDYAEVTVTEDYYGYNQSLSRPLNPVDELALATQFEVSPQARIGIEFATSGGRFRVILDWERNELKLLSLLPGKENKTLSNKQVRLPAQGILDINWFDQRVQVAIDNDLLLDFELSPATSSLSATPPAIGGQGSVLLNRLQVYRDVYYFSDQGEALPAGRGYLLLGDNVPVSQDSRQWPVPSVLAADILGPVEW